MRPVVESSMAGQSCAGLVSAHDYLQNCQCDALLVVALQQ